MTETPEEIRARLSGSATRAEGLPAEVIERPARETLTLAEQALDPRAILDDDGEIVGWDETVPLDMRTDQERATDALREEHAELRDAAADAMRRLDEADLDPEASRVLAEMRDVDWTAAAHKSAGDTTPAEHIRETTQTPPREPRSYYDEAVDLYERAVAAMTAALDAYRAAAAELPEVELPDHDPDAPAPPVPQREVVKYGGGSLWIDERVPILLRDEVKLAARAQNEATAILSRNVAAGLGIADDEGREVHPQWWKRGDRVLTPYSWDGRAESRDTQALVVVTIDHRQALQLATLVLTSDGGSMSRRQHTFDWDDENDRPIDDGQTPIRFEEWWGGGIKVGGTIHPQSRGFIDITQTG